MVEKQDMDSCSVLGGQQMILTGQNFSSDSKVIFMEKTQGKCHGHVMVTTESNGSVRLRIAGSNPSPERGSVRLSLR